MILLPNYQDYVVYAWHRDSGEDDVSNDLYDVQLISKTADAFFVDILFTYSREHSLTSEGGNITVRLTSYLTS